MRRNIFYRYNPDTDNFERYYPSWKERLLSAARFLLAAGVIGVAVALIIFYAVESPSEAVLRKENSSLRSQYNILSRRLDNSLKVMEDIRNRDDNFYRVMMQMEPMSRSRRYAGLDNETRYRQLRQLPDESLITLMTQRLDLFERQLYAQSQSFDELKKQAENQNDKLAHIPSSIPLDTKDLTIASGYGVRRDPVYGGQVFHEGIDVAAKVGTPVYATADGKIAVAERQSGYGNMIEIDHGYNYRTRFAHLNEILVEEGSDVKKGDLIGRVGSSGKSLAPHLHYEVWFKEEPQNPVNFFFTDLTPERYAAMIEEADNAGQLMD